MYVPVMTTCGHNYCYDCLSNWLVSNNANELTCPQCRTPLKDAPSLNSALQELLNTVIEICGLNDTHDLLRGQSITQYKEDYENETLFKNVFKNTAVAVVDDDDGVARCSNCHWEVEGDVCPHCSARMRNRSREYDEDEDEEALSDTSEHDLATLRSHGHHTLPGESDESDSDYDSEEPSSHAARHRFAPFGSARDILNRINAQDRRHISGDEDDMGSDLDSFIDDDDQDDLHSRRTDPNEYDDPSSIRKGKTTSHGPILLSSSEDEDESEGDEEHIRLTQEFENSVRNSHPEVGGSDDIDEEGEEEEEEPNSDYWEHHDGGGFVSGDSLDMEDIDRAQRKTMAKKRRFRVVDDTDDEE
ncbi:LADA_0H06062g1_1 [Lachancea dasiensis]|uniref:LADA_0H06062g1_1 n=1 Tax=Lachancea dasiensis TaxID=1072105 RepID=A0A1G4K1J2_9SACH|nr:LADA_0H06062g1_1 [Lachancea dasiensis]